jgi:hypothetical protein
MKDKDEPQGQPVVHRQPLPHGGYSPSAAVAGQHYSTCPSSRKDGAKCHHDTAETPPIMTELPGKVLGMGMIAVLYLLTPPRPLTDGA